MITQSPTPVATRGAVTVPRVRSILVLADPLARDLHRQRAGPHRHRHRGLQVGDLPVDEVRGRPAPD